MTNREQRFVFSHLNSQIGLSLVEVLLSTAITMMVCAVVVSILAQLNASSRSLRRLTNQYESVRVPAGLLMADGRIALVINCTSDGTQATLALDSSTPPAWYIQYDIITRSGTAVADVYRKEVKSSAVLENEVVAFDMVPTIYTPVGRKLVPTDGTRFECETNTGVGASLVTAHLVKPLLPGQTKRIELEASAHPR